MKAQERERERERKEEEKKAVGVDVEWRALLVGRYVHVYEEMSC